MSVLAREYFISVTDDTDWHELTCIETGLRLVRCVAGKDDCFRFSNSILATEHAVRSSYRNGKDGDDIHSELAVCEQGHAF
ncbi:hypothetical protein [Acetobacter fallax]|uniref:hypothetical protein n=1 Tax=Acetobacter fallax TaxID=1737473 RepID=UPI00156B00C9|nr:hypothetical protein [Acetobacter fallax]NHO34997.1 hypothetical protein [Acetobacter fallax]